MVIEVKQRERKAGDDIADKLVKTHFNYKARLNKSLHEFLMHLDRENWYSVDEAFGGFTVYIKSAYSNVLRKIIQLMDEYLVSIYIQCPFQEDGNVGFLKVRFH